MIYLLFSIITATVVLLIFKLFKKYEIDTFRAIIINYIVAGIFGFLLDNSNIALKSIPHQSWFFISVIMGIFFIFMFNVGAISTQKLGISITSVAAKMSLIIPVIFAVYLYDDSMPFLKIAGIFLALLGVYLTSLPSSGRRPQSSIFSRQNRKSQSKRFPVYIIIIILFVGSGLIDTLFKYTEHNYLSGDDMNLFISTLFIIAALAGIIIGVVKFITTPQIKRVQSRLKTLIGGIILGIVNFGAVYFLVKTLNLENFESSVIFPVNNMGIISLSAICAYMFFKEKLTMKNWTGIALSIAAIAMISLA